MIITKRQLKRIIKEEKAKLVLEANPDGTISDNEEDLEGDLMRELEIEISRLIQKIRVESDKIGGGFRGPGIRARAMKLLLKKIQAAR